MKQRVAILSLTLFGLMSGCVNYTQLDSDGNPTSRTTIVASSFETRTDDGTWVAIENRESAVQIAKEIRIGIVRRAMFRAIENVFASWFDHKDTESLIDADVKNTTTGANVATDLANTKADAATDALRITN